MGKCFWLRCVILAAVGLMTCSATLVTSAQAKKIPGSLTDVGEFGENLYDLTKANGWANAAAKVVDDQDD